jgi:hypothetical protein
MLIARGELTEQVAVGSRGLLVDLLDAPRRSLITRVFESFEFSTQLSGRHAL